MEPKNSSAIKETSEREEVKRAADFIDAGRQDYDSEVGLSREFQNLTIDSNPRQIPLSVRVQSLGRITSRFYSRVIPNSLSFLRMSKRNDEQFKHYNSFITGKPRPGLQVNGYAFLSTPVLPTDFVFCFVIKLGKTNSFYEYDGLRIGFTSCDPKSISWAELPYENVEDLGKRKEYWVWSDPYPTFMRVHDEVCITTENHIEGVFAAQDIPSDRLVCLVDRTIPIWPFFALCGNLTEIQVLGKIPRTLKELLFGNSSLAPPKNLDFSPLIPFPSALESRLVYTEVTGSSRMTSADLKILNGLPNVPQSSPTTSRQIQNHGHHDNRGRGRGRRGQGQGRRSRGNRGQTNQGAKDGETRNENQSSFNGNEDNREQEQLRENSGRGRGQPRGQNRGQRGQGGGRSRARGRSQSHSASK